MMVPTKDEVKMDEVVHNLEDLLPWGRSIRLVRYRDGVPAFQYSPPADRPPVTLARPGIGTDTIRSTRHIHDFPILLTDLRSAWIVAPGRVVDPSLHLVENNCVAIIFDPSVVTDELCDPFLHDSPNGVEQIELPGERRDPWARTLTDLAAELAVDDDHTRRAVVAHLTLLLTDVARVTDARAHRPDDTVAAVFTAIETRFAQPLTLSDIAADVGFSPAYLTTLIRRRTGRTVVQWILSRRMLEARRLLAQTDLPVAIVAARVGIDDAAYFSRLFSREVGMAPRQWRGSQANYPSTPTAGVSGTSSAS